MMRGRYTKREKIEKIKVNILDNFSYKVVALFIALILWLSILNRRDYIVSKDLDVDFVTAANMTVAAQSNDRIRVRVSGPQPLLKKYRESSQFIALDISDKAPGFYDVDMNASKVDVPRGIRVIGIRPNTIRVEVVEKKTQTE